MEIKVKFIVERDGVKHLSQAYTLNEDGSPSHDEVLEQMDGSCTCTLNESDAFCDGSCSEWHNAVVVGKVQWTGLKDKNGTDAYYNDIAWHTDSMGPRKVAVMFDLRMGNICLDCKESGTRIYGGADLIEQIEIIGNTTDTPDLLKAD